MRPAGIHHVAIVVDDADRASAFYRDVLGLTPLQRPDSPDERGCWFDSGGAQLHVMQPKVPASTRPHFAISVDDLGEAVADIRRRGVTVYDVEHTPGAGYQAFLVDPAGNVIELNQAE